MSLGKKKKFIFFIPSINILSTEVLASRFWTYFSSHIAVFRIVFRIRIHQIHMFLGTPDPDMDPLVRGMDPNPAPFPDPVPDPSISKRK
jgi:hypothetical protein